MKISLEGTAVVTGASSGIGQAISQGLGELGMHVCLIGRNQAGLSETTEAVTAAGGSAEQHVLDLNHPGALSSLIETLDGEPSPLTVLVNSAAVYYPSGVGGSSLSERTEMFQVNVLALLDGCHAAIKVMREHQLPSHIINISSLAGRQGDLGVYGATKAAVDHIGLTLREELENDPIRICTLIPGVTQSKLSRHMDAAQTQRLVSAATAKGHHAGPDRSPAIAVPADMANAVKYVVQQPIDVNVHELVIRPARNITF